MAGLGDILRAELDRREKADIMQPAIEKLEAEIARTQRCLQDGIKLSDAIMYEDKIDELKRAIRVLQE